MRAQEACELLAEPDVEIAYRIESVATTDARTLLASQYKAGKTTLLGNLMRSLADKSLFLGRFRVNTPAERIVLRGFLFFEHRNCENPVVIPA